MRRRHPALAVHGALSRGAFAVTVLVSLAVLLVLWGAVSEVLQGIPVLDRDPALGDWLADVLGALAGLLIWAAVDRRRSAG